MDHDRFLFPVPSLHEIEHKNQLCQLTKTTFDKRYCGARILECTVEKIIIIYVNVLWQRRDSPTIARAVSLHTPKGQRIQETLEAEQGSNSGYTYFS